MRETAACFCNLESPAPNTHVAGPLRLRGWIVAKPRFHFVTVRARADDRVWPGVLGFPRSDLAAHFAPDRPWLPAEFQIELARVSGSVPVALEALELGGEWHPFFECSWTVALSAGDSAPADPLTATEFGRTARLGFVLGEKILPPWPRTLRGSHAPFHGFIAQPEAIAPARYGRIEVGGWLFHEEQDIARAFVTSDLVTLQPLVLGGVYPGVAGRFPQHARAAQCRFSGHVDVNETLPHPACVRVFAELADGSVHLVMASQVRPIVTEELKRAWMAYAPFRFWRHWRAVRHDLQAHRIGLETGAALRRQLWQSLRTFRDLATPPARRDSTAATLPVTPHALRRVLFVTHNLNQEGAPLLLLELARHLAETTGTAITLLSPQDGSLRADWSALGARVLLADAALIAARTPDELDAALRSLPTELDLTDTDLVVANTLACFWGVRLASRARLPVAWYIHESTSPHAFPGLPATLLPLVVQALREATAVSFNTELTRAYYEPFRERDNFHLNAAWIDLASLAPHRARQDRSVARTQAGLRADELLVVNLGTVCERKGQHDFLRVIARLAALDPALTARCRFMMIGGRENAYNAELRRNLESLRHTATPPDVRHTNIGVIAETKDVFAYLGAADVFVCTSYEESFPRVVLEAMALGVPIVSTNVHGISRMLRAGTDAWLTRAGDIAALSSSLHAALTEPATAAARTASAAARVAEFDAARLLPEHAAFLGRVAASA